MSKTTYILWFVVAGLYLLFDAILPIVPSHCDIAHRSFSIVMGVFWFLIGMNYKRKYQESLVAVSSSPRN